MVEGKLVPSEMTVKLLLKAMDDNTNDKFLVDGFPRNHDNRETFERMVSHFPDNVQGYFNRTLVRVKSCNLVTLFNISLCYSQKV